MPGRRREGSCDAAAGRHSAARSTRPGTAVSSRPRVVGRHRRAPRPHPAPRRRPSAWPGRPAPGRRARCAPARRRCHPRQRHARWCRRRRTRSCRAPATRAARSPRPATSGTRVSRSTPARSASGALPGAAGTSSVPAALGGVVQHPLPDVWSRRRSRPGHDRPPAQQRRGRADLGSRRRARPGSSRAVRASPGSLRPSGPTRPPTAPSPRPRPTGPAGAAARCPPAASRGGEGRTGWWAAPARRPSRLRGRWWRAGRGRREVRSPATPSHRIRADRGVRPGRRRCPRRPRLRAVPPRRARRKWGRYPLRQFASRSTAADPTSSTPASARVTTSRPNDDVLRSPSTSGEDDPVLLLSLQSFRHGLSVPGPPVPPSAMVSSSTVEGSSSRSPNRSRSWVIR